MAKLGRPSIYTEQLVDEILEKLSEGQSLSEICRADHMPAMFTIRRWCLNKPDFCEKYTRAREIGYLKLAEELLEIADDSRNDWVDRQVGDETVRVLDHEHVQRSRLRLDTRKWILSKMLPKIFGDKIEVSGNQSAPLQSVVRIYIPDNGRDQKVIEAKSEEK